MILVLHDGAGSERNDLLIAALFGVSLIGTISLAFLRRPPERLRKTETPLTVDAVQTPLRESEMEQKERMSYKALMSKKDVTP